LETSASSSRIERRFPFTPALVGVGVGGAYLLFRFWY